MILLVHIIFGVAIASLSGNPYLAVLLAFLSHYFLDVFPHVEYSVDNVREKKWKKVLPDILKVAIDFAVGIILVLLFSSNQPIVYMCAFFAILPDGLYLVGLCSKNKILEIHRKFHCEHLHYFKNKKISNFVRISTQVVAVIISIYILK